MKVRARGRPPICAKIDAEDFQLSAKEAGSAVQPKPEDYDFELDQALSATVA